jgi:hypothetical protein
MRLAKEFFESTVERLAGSETNSVRLFNELQEAQTMAEERRQTAYFSG